MCSLLATQEAPEACGLLLILGRKTASCMPTCMIRTSFPKTRPCPCSKDTAANRVYRPAIDKGASSWPKKSISLEGRPSSASQWGNHTRRSHVEGIEALDKNCPQLLFAGYDTMGASQQPCRSSEKAWGTLGGQSCAEVLRDASAEPANRATLFQASVHEIFLSH